MTELILASSSPRRAWLLERAGLGHRVLVPPGDVPLPGGLPLREAVGAVAAAKVAAVLGEAPDGSLVIGADTVVVGPSGPLGKPVTPQRAREMLISLRGRWHIVLTGICVGRAGAAPLCDTSVARVLLRDLSDAEIADYAAGGEPLDKAGGYAVQGRGADLVDRVEGRVDAVAGLDVELTFELLARAGHRPSLPPPPDITMGEVRLAEAR